MADFRLGMNARNAGAAGIGALFNGGRIEHRTGPPPGTISSPSTGTLLATHTFANPAFGSPVNGAITTNAISPVSAVGSGDAGYFRFYPAGAVDTEAEWQGTSGEAADTPDMVFDDKAIVVDLLVLFGSFVITVPE